jgi:tRNA threonylcarbamoyl adenosine modification protein YeaZ
VSVEHVTQLVLGIDTATVVNVGVAGGDEVLATATVDDPRAHVERLIPLVRQCMTESQRRLSDVEHLVVGMGPGPFTGLRVGIATAQILSTALGIRLHGVCSLDVIAAQYVADFTPADDFAVVTDARRREVYWARYAASGVRVSGPDVGPAEKVPSIPVVGPAADISPHQLSSVNGPRSLDPGVLASVGLRLPAVGTEPLYLRRADATEPTRRKSVLVRRAGGPPR